MEHPEDTDWLRAEHSFLMFLIVLDELRFSKRLTHMLLSMPVSHHIVDFLSKHRASKYPVKGINLL